MKKNYTTLSLALLASILTNAQSGTISWPTVCPNNNCPTSYTDPNGVQISITSSNGSGSGTAVNLTQLQGTTAGPLGISISSTATSTTEGLGLTMNYGTNYSDAITGNLIKINFSKGIKDASFKLYDVTSIPLSCTQMSSTAASYNDHVIITGIDANNHPVNGVLTEQARGSYHPTAGYLPGEQTYIVNDQISISGNEAFVTGGYINTSGIANNITNAGGGVYAVSLDLSVSFPVPVKEIRVTYKNNPGGYLSYYKYSNFCPAGITTANFTTGDLNPQSILIGNVHYNAIVVGLAGKVFTDSNGPVNGADGTVKEGVKVILFDATGTTALDSTLTNVSGDYSFNNAETNTDYIVAITVPAGHSNVSSTDATPLDGRTTVTIGANNVTNIHFGIENTPESYDVTKQFAGALQNGVIYDLTDAPLQGSDATDQPAQGSWNGKRLIITELPGNGFELYYDNTPITSAMLGTSGYTLPGNYDPALLKIYASSVSSNVTSTTFKYATIDAAGATDNSPATFTASWQFPLPLHILSFSGRQNKNCSISLFWATGKEEQTPVISLERSGEGQAFIPLQQFSSKGTGSSYTYTDESPLSGYNYYRLSITDNGHTTAYSEVIKIDNDCGETTDLYPNPAMDYLYIKGITGGKSSICIYSTDGKQVYQKRFNGAVSGIDISNLAAGIYQCTIESDSGTRTIKLTKQ